MLLRAGQFKFSFPRPALVMGILNVTPDSFSDGGCYLEPTLAVERAFRLVEEGADIIDVGGESTRPNAEPVSEAEELRRVLPVLEKLQGRLQIPISIDTYKPVVAREALQRGASIVNDIGAGLLRREMWELVAKSGAGYVLMHIQGTPLTMQLNPTYQHVGAEVEQFFKTQLSEVQRAGVEPEQVVLDVGLGFGKRRSHNLELIAQLSRFSTLGRPLLIGASRKSFLGAGQETGVGERLPAALGVACWCIHSGVQILRTHDVRSTRQTIRIWEEIQEISASRA